MTGLVCMLCGLRSNGSWSAESSFCVKRASNEGLDSRPCCFRPGSCELYIKLRGTIMLNSFNHNFHPRVRSKPSEAL
jgi:hypothetical protein